MQYSWTFLYSNNELHCCRGSCFLLNWKFILKCTEPWIEILRANIYCLTLCLNKTFNTFYFVRQNHRSSFECVKTCSCSWNISSIITKTNYSENFSSPWVCEQEKALNHMHVRVVTATGFQRSISGSLIVSRSLRINSCYWVGRIQWSLTRGSSGVTGPWDK